MKRAKYYNKEGKEVMAESPVEYLKPVHGKNISYDLWEIGDMKVLLRCGIHGVINSNKSSVSAKDRK